MDFIYLMYILISRTIICETQKLEDGTHVEDFIVVNKGRMGYPTISMYIEELPIYECADTCRRHLSCVTFNYNWRTQICELVDQSFDELEADVVEPDWYNYGTPAKIDGGWSNWMNTSCSTTCGNGTLTQYRTCTNPEPKYSGMPCIGNEVRTVRCEIVFCPIDGGLSDWLNDGHCTVSCGGGTLKQKKTCTNPAPQHGGKNCTELPTRTIGCNTDVCLCEGTTLGGCCRFPNKYGKNECWWWRTKYVCHDTHGAFRTCRRQHW